MLDNLSVVLRIDLVEKELHEVLPCLLVQFVVQFAERAVVAVDLGLHHILEEVGHLVVPALLR